MVLKELPLAHAEFCHRTQDAGAATKAAMAAKGTFNTIVDGKYKDDRWSNGTWTLSKFAGKDGETDWDKVRRASRPPRVHRTHLTPCCSALLHTGD